MISKISESRLLTCPNCGHEIPLGYSTDKWTIRSPKDVYERLDTMGLLEREELRVLLLNAKSAVTHAETVYLGNVSASLVRISEVMRPAVVNNSSGIILVHNHPSGDPIPSPDDIHLTSEIIAAGRLLNIDVMDHIIIGIEGYTSLRDKGYISLRDRGMSFT